MVGFGALMMVLAGWRYHLVNRAIEAGYVKSRPQLGLFRDRVESRCSRAR